MWTLAGSAQTDLTSALAILAVSESFCFPLKKTQTSSYVLLRGVVAFLKSTRLIGIGTENLWSNQNKKNHFGAVRVCGTWFLFTLLVCMVAVSSMIMLQPVPRKEGGTEHASLPTARTADLSLRWEPRCQESSCFPLCLCLFGETPLNEHFPVSKIQCRKLGGTLLLLLFCSARTTYPNEVHSGN